MYYKGLQLCYPKSCHEKFGFSYWTRYVVDWARPKKRTGNYYLKRSRILQDAENKIIKKSPDYIIWKDDWGRWNFICNDFKKLPTDKIYPNPNFDIWGTSSFCV